VLTAVVAGWALGLLLPVLVGSALDLTPYTSGFPVANRPLDASTALLMAGGLVVATGLAAAIDSLVNSRRRLGGLLRIGDQ
jgi:putative ABC transport system permease protein